MKATEKILLDETTALRIKSRGNELAIALDGLLEEECTCVDLESIIRNTIGFGSLDAGIQNIHKNKSSK